MFGPDPALPPPTAREQILNAKGNGISFTLVARELVNPRGARIFHPFRTLYPTTVRQLASLLTGRFFQAVRQRFM